MSTVKPNRNLQPCPWCNQPAQCIELSINFYKIGCVNSQCAIQPHITFKWSNHTHAKDTWNKRYE